MRGTKVVTVSSYDSNGVADIWWAGFAWWRTGTIAVCEEAEVCDIFCDRGRVHLCIYIHVVMSE